MERQSCQPGERVSSPISARCAPCPFALLCFCAPRPQGDQVRWEGEAGLGSVLSFCSGKTNKKFTQKSSQSCEKPCSCLCVPSTLPRTEPLMQGKPGQLGSKLGRAASAPRELGEQAELPRGALDVQLPALPPWKPGLSFHAGFPLTGMQRTVSMCIPAD